MAAKKTSKHRKSMAGKKSKKIVPALAWPKKVGVFEVGPRDGLQSEDRVLDVASRVKLIEALLESGLKDIEVGSFVKAERLPQVAHTAEIVRALLEKKKNYSQKPSFWAFIPNEIGLSQAIDAGIDGASFFIGVSDTFCQKNVNRSRADLLAALPALLKTAKKNKLQSRIYLSTLVFCPYEGPIAPADVLKLVRQLMDMGADEVALSDTTGDANPRSLAKVLSTVVPEFGAKNFALHLHDTRGLALANVLEGMRFGISRFDSSVGGMGGCPYAPGASGNLATEDLVNMLLGMGLLSGVDLGCLAKAGYMAEDFLQKRLPARILRTLETNKERQCQ